MKEFIISSENEGQRFDKYLNRILASGTSSFIYKMLRKKNFTLNDKKATGKEILKKGDVVKLFLSDETFNKFKSVNDNSLAKVNNIKNGYSLKDNIIYEDDNIILINKPEGILSQKATADDISVNEYLIDYLISENKISKEQIINYKPSVINRLDRNTSGIIIAAKNLKTAQTVSEGLKNRTINKYYKCIVCGDFSIDGQYSAYLTKDREKNTVKITDKIINDDSERIETEYKKLKSMDGLSEVRVHLITGKSHQIRAHLKYLGFPILGDRKYGNNSINKNYKAKNQLLHAYRIEFPKYDDSLCFDFSGKSFECDPKFRY